MPSRGATPTASMSMYRGRPSQTTVAPWTLKATTVPSARADRLRITKGNSNSATSPGGKARLPLYPVSITASISRSRSRSSGPRTGRLTTASRKPFTTPSITWLSTGNCHRRCATSDAPPAPTRHRRPGVGHAPLRQTLRCAARTLPDGGWRSPRCPRRWRRTRHDGHRLNKMADVPIAPTGRDAFSRICRPDPRWPTQRQRYISSPRRPVSSAGRRTGVDPSQLRPLSQGILPTGPILRSCCGGFRQQKRGCIHGKAERENPPRRCGAGKAS